MEANLTFSEKQYLDDFIKETRSIKPSKRFYFLSSSVLMLGGLVLFTAAVFVTLKSNFNDSVVYWVFIPSVFGLIVTTLAGSLLFKYMRKSEEKEKMAGIIKKLL